MNHLDLRYNQITDLSGLRGVIQEMAIARESESEGGRLLDGNPLKIPPMEIARKGIKAIAAYFASMES